MEEGFIVVNKPIGITSFGVISRLRRITGVKRIGHCGTLDPLASGVLICAIGRSATREIDKFKDQDKIYLAEIEFGKKSTTYDLEGEIEKISYEKEPSLIDLKKVLKKFIGEIEQTPPKYSAKKIGGRRAYDLVRKGIDFEMKKNKIKINKIKIISYNFPLLKVEISCGKGTYIRSIANDLGEKLLCGGTLIALQRKKIGDFDLKNSLQLDEITRENYSKYLLKNF